jgi:hypothetical protein
MNGVINTDRRDLVLTAMHKTITCFLFICFNSNKQHESRMHKRYFVSWFKADICSVLSKAEIPRTEHVGTVVCMITCSLFSECQ